MSYCEEINARMRQAVLDSGISYQELADKLGIHRETIESLMGTTHGLLGPTLLGELCMALSVSADWVLGLKDEDGKEIRQINGLEPPNEPLTLDELRKMDGEPVWITFDGTEHPKEASHWYLMTSWIGEVIIVQGYCDAWRMDPDNYGKYWWAYRHKPEGEPL